MNEETEKEKKVKKPLGKVGLILGINFAGIVAIFLFYIQFNGNPMMKLNPSATVGDFQVYISSSKDVYSAGEPADFKVYLANLSSSYKTFEIYAFNLKITDSSTTVYSSKTSKIVKSTIDPESTVLIYKTNGIDLVGGNYAVKALMNLNGKIVAIGKQFKYTSNISPILAFENDFIVEGQKENVSLYLRNDSTNTLNFDIKQIAFSLSNEEKKVLSTDTITLDSTLTMPSGYEWPVYTYQTKPIQNPGDYSLTVKISGTQNIMATSLISVINKDAISDSGVEIASDIPVNVKSKVPVAFSIFLVNDNVLQKKYITLNSLTVIIKKDNIEVYKFSNSVPRNLRIDAGEESKIKTFQTLTFPESGTYEFEVMAKIGNNFINYHKQIQSS